MNLLRGLLFDNLGLKLVALLLALLVYLNVYTDRPATMPIAFPVQITDLADTLSLLGAAPTEVRAELRGTGKQLIRVRLTEPPIKVSLAGVGVGRFERQLGVSDLPIPGGLEVERLVGPTTLELHVDRRIEKRLPVAPRVVGMPAPGVLWGGGAAAAPAEMVVSGPAGALAGMDSVRLEPVSIIGRRDTLQASVGPDSLPAWCRATPPNVRLTVPLGLAMTRRIMVDVESPKGGEGYRVTPNRVAVILIAPRDVFAGRGFPQVRVHWTAPEPISSWVGHRVGLRRVGDVPEGLRVKIEPDSVTLERAR